MADFIIKKLPYNLTSNAGLALVGQYINRLGVSARVDRKFPIGVGGIANSDILKSYLGLLVQGKNDFDAVEEFRGDDFFTRSLDVGAVPSCSTLRQRMDTHAASWFELAGEFNEALLSAKYATGPVDFGPLPCGPWLLCEAPHPARRRAGWLWRIGAQDSRMLRVGLDSPPQSERETDTIAPCHPIFTLKPASSAI